MATAKPAPFILWRDGKPRFEPGPRERDRGFRGEDLRHGGDGPWFTFEEAKAWGEARYAAIRAAREAGRIVRAQQARGDTLGELLDDWLKSDDVADLAATTRDGYRWTVNAIRWQPQTDKDRKAGRERVAEAFAQTNVRAIGKPEVKAFFEYQRRARGHHQALAVVAVVRAAYSWGETSSRWRLAINPALRLKLARPKPRIVIYTMAEVRALVDAADAGGRASIGDAILLGLYTGQRQGDRLALEDAGLVDGRRQFRQSKTGALVAIPETPELRTRLEAAKARVAALKLRLQTRPETLVVDETTGEPYNKHTYRHVFAEVRAAAAAGIVDDQATAAAAMRGQNVRVWRVAPCPSLAGKRDQDLRDTAVTWLGRAGATIPEIASITGHSPQSIYQVLKHYLAITPEMADAAIAKLVTWMEREGMTG